MSKNIPYQSFCWVMGTTSFRTAKLNLKIEEQLLLLDEFYHDTIKKRKWKWDVWLQSEYYDFMKNKGFLSGSAKRKDKDAREKTSGLVDIGLVTEERLITHAGKVLLQVTKEGNFNSDNIFNVDKDSYIYLKQLLKASVNVNGKNTRPFIIVLKCLINLGYLSYDEFTYLVPLIKDEKTAQDIIANIWLHREGKLSLEDIIYKNLMDMSNYQLAETTLLNNVINEDLILLVGMNRKSRNYDKPYYMLYQKLKEIFLEGSSDYVSLLETMKLIRNKPGVLWRNLIFKTTSKTAIRKTGKNSLNEHTIFDNCNNETELKKAFFKYLHVFKAMATLSDYFDLNRRYFNVSDLLIFEDRQVKLDILPKYYFTEIINELYEKAFVEDQNLNNDVELEVISEAFNFDIKKIYSILSRDLGITINSKEQVSTYINDERYRRFNALIDRKFTDSVLLELLDCFERRDDRRIEEIVTDEAAVPTIFEYILGIIWYKASERQGNILEFMKLSLEANLLPKTHAAGGYADIVYEYEACPDYPKHSLLLEATLADSTNQRRMEMEPVSRHLGDYRIRYNNPFDYTLFVSTYLDKNVVSDFRFRKIMPYTKNDETIQGMKIISMDTKALKRIVENNIYYRYLYKVFDKYHEMPLETVRWHEEMIQEATQEYK